MPYWKFGSGLLGGPQNKCKSILIKYINVMSTSSYMPRILTP